MSTTEGFLSMATLFPFAELEEGAGDGAARERKREEMGAKKPPAVPLAASGPSRQMLTCA